METIVHPAPQSDAQGGTASPETGPASIIFSQGRKRLELISKLLFVLTLLAAGLVPLGISRPETLPVYGMVLLTATALFGVARSSKFSDEQVINFGLVAQVLFCAVISIPSIYMSYEYDREFRDVTWTCITILVFPLLAPSHPSRNLAAGLVCALTAPVGVLIAYASFGDSPDFGNVLGMSVSPTFCVIFAYFGSRTLYRLGVDIERSRRLGSYQLVEKLGEGGMGEVWKAEHQLLARPAAIKLIKRSAQSPRDATAVEAQLQRFEREVQLTARLSHPNTITVFDYGHTEDGTFYYVMELLDGASLQDIVDRVGPQPPERVVAVLLDVAGALQEAHDAGLIHRDIKPANIILCTQGGKPDVAKLLDFGLVKDISDGQDLSLTGEGTISGTPLYMAPEAYTSPSNDDVRSDIYALGAVGYFLLTGSHVFDGATLAEICGHHLHSQPESPSERLGSAVPSEVEAILLDCLAKAPKDRPASAHEVASRLRGCQLAHVWQTNDAQDWWDEYGALLRRPVSGQ